jgi:DNA-binding beta-propeller fold protein YncE
LNDRIRQISIGLDAVVTTLAGGATGGGTYAGGDGIGTHASFSSPTGISISKDEAYLFVADSGGSKIRQILTSTGAVTSLFPLVPGNSRGVATHPQATIVFIANTNNHQVKSLTTGNTAPPTSSPTSSAGELIYIAGSGIAGSQDGVGMSARFNQPFDLSTSYDGSTIVVADTFSSAVRKVDVASGTVTTLGSGFSYPAGVVLTADGTSAYVADTSTV